MDLKKTIKNLPKNLLYDWYYINSYFSKKNDEQRFTDFKKLYNNFEGESINEFLNVNDYVMSEWKNWKYKNHYSKDFEIGWNSKKNSRCRCWYDCKHVKKQQTFSDVWVEFKNDFQLNTPESKLIFEEMDKIKMSNSMLQEWSYKHYNDHPHVYGDSDGKTKSQLWNEFKETWEIDIDDYNEKKYDEMADEIKKGLTNSGYEKWFEFIDDYNNYENYSIIEKYEIWNNFYDNTNNFYENDSDNDEINELKNRIKELELENDKLKNTIRIKNEELSEKMKLKQINLI